MRRSVAVSGGVIGSLATKIKSEIIVRKKGIETSKINIE